MPFGIHSEHLQLGCMISIIIIILTIIIVHPKEVGGQLYTECLGEHRAAWNPGCDLDPKFQRRERSSVWTVLANALVSRGWTEIAWGQKTFPLWPITHGL